MKKIIIKVRRNKKKIDEKSTSRIEIIGRFHDDAIIPLAKGSPIVLTEIDKPGLAISDFPRS